MPTVQVPQKVPASRRGGDLVAGFAGAILLAAILLSVASSVGLPGRVERITVVNPHAWNAAVDVTTASRSGWLGLGVADRQSEQAFEEVMDQGDRWLFRFSYAGTNTELAVDRSQLERDDWTITIPSQFSDLMRQSGTRPSAQ